MPESPYLLHGGQLHLEPADIFAAAQEAAYFETEVPAVKKSILKLEPKPRSLFKYECWYCQNRLKFSTYPLSGEVLVREMTTGGEVELTAGGMKD